MPLVLEAYVAAVGSPDVDAVVGWTAEEAAATPVLFAADVAVAAALAHPDADRAARLLASLAAGAGRLAAPRTDPAFAAAAVAFGAHELLGRVAALDARATHEPRVDQAEAALLRYMDSVDNTDASALTKDHWHSVGLLAVPPGARHLLNALTSSERSFFEYRVEIPADPANLLGVVVGERADAVRNPFGVWRARDDAWTDWRRVLVHTLPAAHAALTLVAHGDRRFTRTAVRLAGDPWPGDEPTVWPTLVLLGARTFVIAQTAVVAYGGPGTGLAAWRAQLRAAIGLAGPDRLSPFFGDSLP